MRADRTARNRIDALDLAAIWPACAQVAGSPLPPIEAAETPRRRPDEVDDHGIW